MQDVSQYLFDEALILIPVLYILGMFIKGIPNIPDWTTPFLLLVFGIVGGVLLVGDPVQGVIQGVLVTGATVLSNQLIKQATSQRE